MSRIKKWKSDIIHNITNVPIKKSDSIVFKKDNQLHNIEFPAKIRFYPETNRIREITYYNNSRKHREGDKPAVIYYYANGNKKLEQYYINGRLHRQNDKPAEIHYYEDGSVEFEEYRINDLRHRYYGPTIIYYEPYGEITKSSYYYEGYEVGKPEPGYILKVTHNFRINTYFPLTYA